MILITGANGYIGQKIAQAIPDAIPYSVRFNHKVESEIEHQDYSIPNFSNFKPQKTILIHCASSLTIRGNKNTSQFEVLSESFRFFESIARQSNKLHIIYPSSGGNIYKYTAPIPHKETDETTATTLYTQSKLTHETFLYHLQKKYKNVRVSILRISNPYGSIIERERKQGLIGVAIRCLMENTPLNLFAAPETVRDYIHFDDLCNLIKKITLSTNAENFEVLNVGSGQGHSIISVLQNIEAVFGSKIQLNIDSNKQSVFESPWSVLDIKSAKEKYNWSPQISLEAGLKKIKEQGGSI